MDFAWPEELQQLADEARELGAAAAQGREVKEESWVIGFEREFSLELGKRGWLGMTWPMEVGGGGRHPLERFVVTEALISAGAPLAATWVGDRQIGPTLIAYGDDEQRRRYLPDMIEGRVTWSIGMSEPDAGSDLASLRTRAVRDGSSYVLEGRKIWTSFGLEADYCYLIARTDPQAPAHKGMSEFVLPLDAPGVTIVPIKDMTGGEHFCEVELDGVRIPAENLVGEPNGSWRQVMRQLEHERSGIDRLVSNRALFEDAVDRADTTSAVVRQEIADLHVRYEIGRMLVIREVLGQGTPQFSAATKVYCTELEQRVADFAGRMMAPDTLLAGRTARGVCYAPAYSIQGGTSAILRNVIAERVLGLPR